MYVFSIVFDFLFIYTASFYEKHNNKSLFSLFSPVCEFGRKYGIFEKKKRNSDEWRESRTEASGKLPQPSIAGFFPKKKGKAHSTFAIEDIDIRVMWHTFRSNLLCRVAMLFVSPRRRVISCRGGRARAATAPSLFFSKGFSADS